MRPLAKVNWLILADWVVWVGYSQPHTCVSKCTRARVLVKAKAVASSTSAWLCQQDRTQTGGAVAASMWFELKLEWQRWFVE